MSSRIRELKQNLEEQTQVIKTMREEKKGIDQVIRSLYLSLVKAKPEFNASQTRIEQNSYPDLKGDDLNRLRPKEIIEKIGETMGVLFNSTSALRDDIKDIYRELDADVDAKMNEWNILRAQLREDDSQARLFRDNPVSTSMPSRAETPDIAMVDRTRADSGVASPPTPTITSGRKDAQPKSPTKEKKTNASTLAGVVNGSRKK